MLHVKLPTKRLPVLWSFLQACIAWLSSKTYARWIVIALCLGVMLAGLYRQFRPAGAGSQVNNSDFHAVYTAAIAVREGQNPFGPAVAVISRGADFADTHGEQVGTPFVYSPVVAVAFIPFTWLPFSLALFVWDFCNVALLIGSVYFLLRCIGSRPSVLSIVVMTLIASYTAPVRAVLFWGQSDILILCLLSAALATRLFGQSQRAGVLLALACVIKPMLLAILPFLLWKREFRLVVVSLGAFLAMLLAPFVALGWQTWQDQVLIWRFWTNVYVTFLFNFAPKGILARLFGPNAYVQPLIVAPELATVLWLVVVIAVLLLTLVVIAPRPLVHDRRSLLDIALMIIAFLLISPLTEDNHVTLLLASVVLLYGWLRGARWDDTRYRVMMICAIGGIVLLLAPLHSIESILWDKMAATPRPLGDVYMILSATFLYVMVFYFVLILHAIALDSEKATIEAVREWIAHLPQIFRQYLADVYSAWLSKRTDRTKVMSR